MKILIAEDDLISGHFMTKFLSRFGECDLVVNGLEAIKAFLKALKDEPYNLICLDVMMPIVDGMKALKAIRDLEKRNGILQNNYVKIMMTTALSEERFIQTAFDYGCNSYLTKPIDIQKFIKVIENWAFR